MSSTSWLESFELPRPPMFPPGVLAKSEMTAGVSFVSSAQVCPCFICDTACAEMLNFWPMTAYWSEDVRISMMSVSERDDLPRPPVVKQSAELSPLLPGYRWSGQMHSRCSTQIRACSTHLPGGTGPTNSSYETIWALRNFLPIRIKPYPFHDRLLVHSQCPSTILTCLSSRSRMLMVLLYYGYHKEYTVKLHKERR
jgi:hypothetical protein